MEHNIQTVDEFLQEEEDNRTSKEKLRGAFKKDSFISGFDTPEELYARILTDIVTKKLQLDGEGKCGKLDKGDEVTLKALQLMGNTLGFTTQSKEYIIQSAIPKLDRKSITRA